MIYNYNKDLINGVRRFVNMTNEEFQEIVIEKLGNIDTKLENLDSKVENIEKEQQTMRKEQLEMKNDQQTMREEQLEMKDDIKSIIEQTAELTEFRYEINEKLDRLVDEFNTMEIVTSKNWNDIAKMKAAR